VRISIERDIEVQSEMEKKRVKFGSGGVRVWQPGTAGQRVAVVGWLWDQSTRYVSAVRMGVITDHEYQY
jgi:hypothetical protein